jgi:hypothetical protein
LLPLEGTFGKACLGSIGKLLYVPLEALFAHLIFRISILFDQVIQQCEGLWRYWRLEYFNLRTKINFAGLENWNGWFGNGWFGNRFWDILDYFGGIERI